MLGLTPGNLITHLRKLEDAGYLVTEKSDARPSADTSVALTNAGRRALDDYSATLRASSTASDRRVFSGNRHEKHPRSNGEYADRPNVAASVQVLARWSSTDLPPIS